MSLDFDLDADSQKFRSSIKDEKSKNPLDILIDKETTEDLAISVQTLLDNKLLSDKQKNQIKMYYFQNKTLSDIGKCFGVSREAVRQNIKRALDIIKSYDD
jgi:RNA polymerase sigma factor (sigma-70 family)